MPTKKVEMPPLRHGVCIFCEKSEDNPEIYGKMLQKDKLTVHYFCMLFASGLCQNGKSEAEGILGFLPKDILSEVKRGRRLKCVFCHRVGATIGCVVRNCRKAFHFGCGREHGVLNQFNDNYSSFCQEHRPRQEICPADVPTTPSCAICMNVMDLTCLDNTLKSPCCKNSWFHQDCIQRQSTFSGVHFFKCPLCNNKDEFQQEMLLFGIYIPDQDAAWELEPNAYRELLERYCHCDVDKCLCPKGRDYNKDNSKWEVLLCDWCGSHGCHLQCGGHKTPLDHWVCHTCRPVADKAKVEASAATKAIEAEVAAAAQRCGVNVPKQKTPKGIKRKNDSPGGPEKRICTGVKKSLSPTPRACFGYPCVSPMPSTSSASNNAHTAGSKKRHNSSSKKKKNNKKKPSSKKKGSGKKKVSTAGAGKLKSQKGKKICKSKSSNSTSGPNSSGKKKQSTPNGSRKLNSPSQRYSKGHKGLASSSPKVHNVQYPRKRLSFHKGGKVPQLTSPKTGQKQQKQDNVQCVASAGTKNQVCSLGSPQNTNASKKSPQKSTSDKLLKPQGSVVPKSIEGPVKLKKNAQSAVKGKETPLSPEPPPKQPRRVLVRRLDPEMPDLEDLKEKPKWFQDLMNEDIMTGANLGAKFAPLCLKSQKPANTFVVSMSPTGRQRHGWRSLTDLKASDATRPLWLANLLKEDFITGANLGAKFADMSMKLQPTNRQKAHKRSKSNNTVPKYESSSKQPESNSHPCCDEMTSIYIKPEQSVSVDHNDDSVSTRAETGVMAWKPNAGTCELDAEATCSQDTDGDNFVKRLRSNKASPSKRMNKEGSTHSKGQVQSNNLMEENQGDLSNAGTETCWPLEKGYDLMVKTELPAESSGENGKLQISDDGSDEQNVPCDLSIELKIENVPEIGSSEIGNEEKQDYDNKQEQEKFVKKLRSSISTPLKEATNKDNTPSKQKKAPIGSTPTSKSGTPVRPTRSQGYSLQGTENVRVPPCAKGQDGFEASSNEDKAQSMDGGTCSLAVGGCEPDVMSQTSGGADADKSCLPSEVKPEGKGEENMETSAEANTTETFKEKHSDKSGPGSNIPEVVSAPSTYCGEKSNSKLLDRENVEKIWRENVNGYESIDSDTVSLISYDGEADGIEGAGLLHFRWLAGKRNTNTDGIHKLDRGRGLRKEETLVGQFGAKSKISNVGPEINSSIQGEASVGPIEKDTADLYDLSQVVRRSSRTYVQQDSAQGLCVDADNSSGLLVKSDVGPVTRKRSLQRTAVSIDQFNTKHRKYKKNGIYGRVLKKCHLTKPPSTLGIVKRQKYLRGASTRGRAMYPRKTKKILAQKRRAAKLRNVEVQKKQVVKNALKTFTARSAVPMTSQQETDAVPYCFKMNASIMPIPATHVRKSIKKLPGAHSGTDQSFEIDNAKHDETEELASPPTVGHSPGTKKGSNVENWLQGFGLHNVESNHISVSDSKISTRKKDMHESGKAQSLASKSNTDTSKALGILVMDKKTAPIEVKEQSVTRFPEAQHGTEVKIAAISDVSAGPDLPTTCGGSLLKRVSRAQQTDSSFLSDLRRKIAAKQRNALKGLSRKKTSSGKKINAVTETRKQNALPQSSKSQQEDDILIVDVDSAVPAMRASGDGKVIVLQKTEEVSLGKKVVLVNGINQELKTNASPNAVPKVESGPGSSVVDVNQNGAGIKTDSAALNFDNASKVHEGVGETNTTCDLHEMVFFNSQTSTRRFSENIVFSPKFKTKREEKESTPKSAGKKSHKHKHRHKHRSGHGCLTLENHWKKNMISSYDNHTDDIEVFDIAKTQSPMATRLASQGHDMPHTVSSKPESPMATRLATQGLEEPDQRDSNLFVGGSKQRTPRRPRVGDLVNGASPKSQHIPGKGNEGAQ